MWKLESVKQWVFKIFENILCTSLQSIHQIIVLVLNVISVLNELVFKCTFTKPSEEIELIFRSVV